MIWPMQDSRSGAEASDHVWLRASQLWDVQHGGADASMTRSAPACMVAGAPIMALIAYQRTRCCCVASLLLRLPSFQAHSAGATALAHHSAGT